MKEERKIERVWKVYKHTSPSNKIYIGITSKKNINQRWKNGEGYKNQVFYNAIQKYGWDNIKHEILFENLTKEEAEEKEIELIAFYKSNQLNFGYNRDNGGNCIGTFSDSHKKNLSISNSRPVICDKIEYYGAREFCNIHNLNYSVVKSWLGGYDNMPIEWYVLGLRYKDVPMSFYNIQRGKAKGKDNPMSKRVVCEDIEFDSVKECALYYNVEYSAMICWLNGSRAMPQEWYDKGLRYEDKQMSDYKVQKRKLKKKLICDNVLFNSLKEFTDYYGLVYGTAKSWLQGKNKMPQKFKDMNLHYATQDEIKEYNKNIK